MQKIDAEKLLLKYAQGLSTLEERALVESGLLNDLIQNTETISEDEILNAGERMKLVIDQHTGPKRTILTFWPRIAAAASILLAISAGGYFLLHKATPKNQVVQNQAHDLAPGRNTATLILANGQKISISDAKNGTIASQGQTTIRKTANGKLVYANGGTNDFSGTNTLVTARGEQSSVTLSDGTIAYLNAASSIQYPVNFTGPERKVIITGEVLFEVVHNAAKPFRVMAKGQIIEDLGTQFDVSAYDDEPITSTTLIKGSIKVRAGNNPKEIVVKPGQEAVSANNSDHLQIMPADLEKTTAWKNGNFVFTGDNITTIMRQVARWYDADIVYQTSTAHKTFVGSVSRFSNVSEVLKTMEITGTVHFKVEGRRITVMP
jgi:transmembrane sensor